MTTNGIKPIGTQPSHGGLQDELNQSVQTVQNLTPQEAAQKAKQGAQDTWVGNVAGGVAPKDMTAKKAIFSVALTALMVFGISLLGRNTKMFKNVGDLGDKISKALKLGNPDGKFAKFSKGIKTWMSKKGTLRGKIVGNIQEIFKKSPDGVRENLLRGKSSFTKTMAPGTRFEVVDNVADPLRAMYRTKVEANTPFQRLMKPLKTKLRLFTEGSVEKKLTNQKEFQKLLKDSIRKAPDLAAGEGVGDYKTILKLLKQESIQPEEEFKLFGLLKKYFANDIKNGNELFTSKAHGFKVDFIDSLRRAEMINAGEGGLYNAKTKLGRLLQKGLFRAMEAPSNGVASRGIMPLAIALPIQWGIANKVYDAPKNEKGKKFAEETVRDAGNYMLIPTVMGTMYGSASLFKYFGLKSGEIQNYKNLIKAGNFDAAKTLMQTTGKWWEKALRYPGKLLGMGLEGKPNKLAGAVGGAGRLWLYIAVLSPLFIKPVIGLCHKIFGKPSDTKAEEDAKKAEKDAKKQTRTNQIAFAQRLREMGMTQEDIANQLAQRPDIIQRLQTEPQLAEQLDKNPLILLDLLATAPAQQPAAPTPANPQGWPMQPAAPAQPMQPQGQTPQGLPTQPAAPAQPTQPAQPAAPSNSANPPRTYIPSSAPVVQGVNMSPDQQSKLSKIYADADRAEAEAMKYL